MDTKTNFRDLVRSQTRDLSIVGTWDAEGKIAVREPARNFDPHIWRWADLRPLILSAAEHFTLADAIRRVLVLANPAVYPKHHSTNTLYVSCSVYNGGEKAPVHRHTANASRFVLEGSGGYTNIEGEKCVMNRGDLIVTPNGAWHDHGNDGTDPVIWMDVLDLPLAESLGSVFFEFDLLDESGKPKPIQDVTSPERYSQLAYGVGGLKPAFISHQRGANDFSSPMFVYPWDASERALNSMRNLKGSPYDGILLDFVDPTTGSSVTPTLGFSIQLLRPREHTLSHRHTSSVAYCCLRGSGATVIDGQKIEWKENDIFVLPGWRWHEHVNEDYSEDAILYAVSDAPALKKLGLYREEGK